MEPPCTMETCVFAATLACIAAYGAYKAYLWRQQGAVLRAMARRHGARRFATGDRAQPTPPVQTAWPRARVPGGGGARAALRWIYDVLYRVAESCRAHQQSTRVCPDPVGGEQRRRWRPEPLPARTRLAPRDYCVLPARRRRAMVAAPQWPPLASAPPVPGASAPKRVSAGERECRRVMEALFRCPFPTARPDFLRNPVTGNAYNLELDCYNKRMRLAVEYNGIQHYKYTSYFHKNKEAFLNQKYRDDMKRRICRDMGITLLEVPCTVRIDRIADYLKDQLREAGYDV